MDFLQEAGLAYVVQRGVERLFVAQDTLINFEFGNC
jgi:hypothetical protein